MCARTATDHLAIHSTGINTSNAVRVSSIHDFQRVQPASHIMWSAKAGGAATIEIQPDGRPIIPEYYQGGAAVPIEYRDRDPSEIMVGQAWFCDTMECVRNSADRTIVLVCNTRLGANVNCSCVDIILLMFGRRRYGPTDPIKEDMWEGWNLGTRPVLGPHTAVLQPSWWEARGITHFGDRTLEDAWRIGRHPGLKG